jgi:hypothetical protein
MQENGIDKCSDMDVVFAAYDADGSSVWDSGEIAIALE